MPEYSATVMEGVDRQGRAVLGDWWEKATCKEMDCPHYLMGWRTTLDETREDMKDAADWIRHRSGLSFVESRDVEGLTEFMFEPGQRCFREHLQPSGKPGKLTRKNAAGVYLFEQPQDFNEAMNEDSYAAERLRERG